jgi:hypothetical protein
MFLWVFWCELMDHHPSDLAFGLMPMRHCGNARSA